MKFRFLINRETARKDISTEEYEAIEMAQDGEPPKIYRLRPLVARFMVDNENKSIPHKQALKELGKIPLEEFLQDVFPAFAAAMAEAAIPNTNGDSSKPPSEAAPNSESPIGSEQ